MLGEFFRAVSISPYVRFPHRFLLRCLGSQGMFASREVIVEGQSGWLASGSWLWRLLWYMAISLAMVDKFSEYLDGEDSRRQSSIMVSWFFLSFPFAHQNLLIVLL